MLHEKVAVVTGAGRGVGRGIALKLAQKGAKVVVNDIDERKANEVSKLIKERGGSSLGVVADVSNKSDVERLMRKTFEEFGRLDIVVNNAGEFQGALLEDMTEEQWDRVIDVDLKGAFLCTQAAAPYMRKGKYGRIINISSPDAVIGDIGMANYVAAKIGLFGLTVSVAKEFSRWVKEEGCVMTCNCVLVGYNVTRLTEEVLPKKVTDRFRKIVPFGRPSDPEEDVGNLVAFLSSEKASYITGAKIPVTGGLYATITTY